MANIINYIQNNKEWIFSGVGLVVVAAIVKIVLQIVRIRPKQMQLLSSKNRYLQNIYHLYERAQPHDQVCTCTSSWPLDYSRTVILQHLKASSVTFLGPIRSGSSFVGILWRMKISDERDIGPFRFLHREAPGLKFVVVGNSVVISESSTERPSQGGAKWSDHRELARLLRDHFHELAGQAISLETRVCSLIEERLKDGPSRSASISELLPFLTGPSGGREHKHQFPESEQIVVLERFLARILPRHNLVYERRDGCQGVVTYVATPHRDSSHFELPALRICETRECNFNCCYCPTGGENFPKYVHHLPFTAIDRFISLAKQFGFRHFRFTGGEPLRQSQELLECIDRHLLGLSSYNVSIATNGSSLATVAEELIKRPEIRLKVSLDTLNPARFRKITGVNSGIFEKLLHGLDMVKGRCTVGINTVVTRMNLEDIPNLLQYCINNGFYLKLMDLNWYADQKSPDFYAENYVPLSDLTENLMRKFQKHNIVTTVGGFGIPMIDMVVTEKTFIRVKNHEKGSHYAPFCTYSCDLYPCQEGLYQLTFTSDGKLRLCRHRPDIAVDVFEALMNEQDHIVLDKLNHQIETFFRHAFFVDHKRRFQPL